MAYEAWRDDAEANADYNAEPYTKKLAESSLSGKLGEIFNAFIL